MLLTVLDRHWREHLYEMDYLQEGIGLRAIGQRDPLVEYQREGFDMFVAMQDSIKREAVAYVFNASIQVVDEDEQRRQALPRHQPSSPPPPPKPSRRPPPPPSPSAPPARRSAATNPAPAAQARSTSSATAPPPRP